MIIGISGKINSGKDTIGLIIQWLTGINSNIPFKEWVNSEYNYKGNSNFEIHKFADALKNIVCILTSCTREQLEDREFKEKPIGSEWNHTFYHIVDTQGGILEKFLDKTEAEYYLPYWEDNITVNYPPEIVAVEQILTRRLLMQLLGTECGRNIIHPNIWVNALMSKYKFNIKPGTPDYPNWIITDVRFPNEAQAIKDRGGILIRINRIPTAIIKGVEYFVGTDGLPEHPSESALDNAEFDYVINNDSTIEDLIDKVKYILIKEKIL